MAFHITHSDRSKPSHLENTQESLWRETEASHQQPAPTYGCCEWDILEADPLAQLMVNCNFTVDLKPELSNVWIPDPQKLCGGVY